MTACVRNSQRIYTYLMKSCCFDLGPGSVRELRFPNLSPLFSTPKLLGDVLECVSPTETVGPTGAASFQDFTRTHADVLEAPLGAYVCVCVRSPERGESSSYRRRRRWYTSFWGSGAIRNHSIRRRPHCIVTTTRGGTVSRESPNLHNKLGPVASPPSRSHVCRSGASMR